MKRLAILLALALSLVATPVAAVNDRLVPAEDCAPANAEAVGHPAFGSPPFNPPFSLNNPGKSPGAQGQLNSRAEDHCPNAQ